MKTLLCILAAFGLAAAVSGARGAAVIGAIDQFSQLLLRMYVRSIIVKLGQCVCLEPKLDSESLASLCCCMFSVGPVQQPFESLSSQHLYVTNFAV